MFEDLSVVLLARVELEKGNPACVDIGRPNPICML
jgi:hypothetical protein